jgi:hypothetical protein
VALVPAASRMVVPDTLAPLAGTSTLVVGVVVALAGDSATNPTTMTAKTAATDTRKHSQRVIGSSWGTTISGLADIQHHGFDHPALAPYAWASIGSREVKAPNGKGWSAVVEWAKLGPGLPVLPIPPR